MNKKLKRMAIVGATVLMTASSVGFSNAMSVKNINPIQSTGKVYICVNGKKLNFNFTGMSILDSLKWFNHNKTNWGRCNKKLYDYWKAHETIQAENIIEEFKKIYNKLALISNADIID